MTTLNQNNTTTPEAATAQMNREKFISLKALIYAIAHIQSLPKDRQEYSDMLDMCELVYESSLSWPAIYHAVYEVERHIQREVDIFPGDGGEQDRLEMRAHLDAMKASVSEQLRCFNAGEAV